MASVLVAAISPILLSSCAKQVAAPEVAHTPPRPLNQTLDVFAAAHARKDFNTIAALTAKGAELRSPAMPRPGKTDAYIRALEAEPFTLSVSGTEVLYANNMGAKTRSRARLTAPARFALDERLEVVWKMEDGQWKIADLDYPDWAPVVGSWRKAGPRGEESLELRLLPGGTYLVYAERDRTLPTFRGSYTLSSGILSLVDSSASVARNLNTSEGRYLVITTRNNLDLRKIADDNRWRADRFDGLWSAADK